MALPMAKELQVDPQKRFVLPLLMAQNPTNETTTMMMMMMMMMMVMIAVIVVMFAVGVGAVIDEKNL